MAGFSFLDTIITVLGVVKKGAEVLDAVTSKEKDSSGFAQPKPMDTQTSGGSATAPLQNMEQPIGIKIPNMESAYRYFSDNLSRDTNLRYLQGENYVAKRNPILKTSVVGTDNIVRKTSVPKP